MFVVFYIIATNSSILVQLKLTWSVNTNITILRVLCIRLSLGKSNIWSKNNNIKFLTFLTYFIFSNMSDITFKKKLVYINILWLALVAFISRDKFFLEDIKFF